jgi:L-lactate dehydrogenase
MPAVLGRHGVERAIPIQLDETETAELQACAANLRSVIEGAEKELEAGK